MIQDYQIYSAQILHEAEDLVIAVYIQEFFKFCGICTRIQEIDSTDDKIFYWDKVVILNHCMEETAENSFVIYGQDEENAVMDTAKVLGGDVFMELAQIFLKNGYAKANYQIHCFLKQMDQQALLDVAQIYYSCFLELRELEKKIKQEQAENNAICPVLYALLTCARKINILCQQRGNLLYFDVLKISSEAEKLKEFDPEFFMGDAVLALVSVQDPKLYDQGMQAIERAIQTGDKKKKYISFLRYFYAHFLEEEIGNKKKARESYQKMLQIQNTYYRALYKEAYYLWKDQNYMSALTMFLKMTEQLEQKRKSGWIQPMELEYLYKGCMFIEHIAEEHKENGILIPAYVYRVIAEKNKLFEKSKFIQSFWRGGLENEENYFEKKLAKYHV